MKVKELIRELKKLPQDLKVGIAFSDNDEEEAAGWVSYTIHFRKEDFMDPEITNANTFRSMPEECVIIRC